MKQHLLSARTIFIGTTLLALCVVAQTAHAQDPVDMAVYQIEGPHKSRMLKAFTGNNLQGSLAPIAAFGSTVYEEPLNRFAENSLEICTGAGSITYEEYAQQIARKYDINRNSLDDIELNDAFRATMAIVFRLTNRPLNFYAATSTGQKPRVVLLLAMEQQDAGLPRILKAWAGDDLTAFLGYDALQAIEATIAAGGSDEIQQREVRLVMED